MPAPRPQPKLAGMFTSPCGAWVHPYRMASGFVWFAPVAATARIGAFWPGANRVERSKLPVAGEGA